MNSPISKIIDKILRHPYWTAVGVIISIVLIFNEKIPLIGINGNRNPVVSKRPNTQVTYDNSNASTSSESNQIVVSTSIGSIITSNQSGGTNTINNNLDLPEPNIYVDTITTNTPSGANFTSEYLLKVDAKIPANTITITISSSVEIVDARAIPQRVGLMFGGLFNVEKNVATTQIERPVGDYKIIVTTATSAKIKFEGSYE